MKKYAKALLIWASIIPIAILNGGLREYVLIHITRYYLPLSGIILSVCIFSLSYLLIPRIEHCTKRDYILFGVLWFILTNLFDLAGYISSDGGFKDLVEAYNIFTGNTWALVTLTCLFSPIATAKLRKTI